MAVNSFREDEKVESQGKWKVIIRLLSYLKDYKAGVAGVLLCMMMTVAISLVNPLLIEAAIDKYIDTPNADMAGLIRLGLFAAVLNIIFIILVKVRMYEMSKISNKILLTVRQELYVHIQKLSFTFFDSRPTGKILARIIGDVNSLKDVLSSAVTILIPDFITVIGVVAIMMFKNWRLALASLCTIPLMFIAIFVIQIFSYKEWHNYRKKSSNMNAFVHEDIAGISVVKSLTAEKETTETFDKLSDETADGFIRACRVSDLFGPSIDMCWGIGVAVMYLVGVQFLGFPEITVGALVSFGTYINMFWMPIMNLSDFYNQLTTNVSAAERIFDILDTEPDIADESHAIELPDIEGAVEFSHVSFTYDEGTEQETRVLDDVSFSVKPGETIALVGPTGAGKTTIVNLISRFYDIQKGSILIDGYELKDVSLHSLRKQMGVMTQDNFIFHGTIRENIMYGKLDATEEEMIAAAKAVNAHEFIMKMEKGYDTELSERGAGLSIGQRQLIAFARTMISMPKILILDEATSSIDTHTERMVQEGIAALLKGRTSFVIAHRLSTIQNADRIFVVSDGGIIESGTPAELMELRGAYYRLYMAQVV